MPPCFSRLNIWPFIFNIFIVMHKHNFLCSTIFAVQQNNCVWMTKLLLKGVSLMKRQATESFKDMQGYRKKIFLPDSIPSTDDVSLTCLVQKITIISIATYSVFYSESRLKLVMLISSFREVQKLKMQSKKWQGNSKLR